MNTALPLHEPEFASAEDAEAHDRWFQEKVRASLGDAQPLTPHEELMAKLRERVEAKRLARAADPMAR